MNIRLLSRVAGLAVVGVIFCFVLGPKVSASEIHRLNRCTTGPNPIFNRNF
jgi:hypothetical protein